ncbi:TIGR03435 family protein [Granulicella sp. 5B5]|uniref:TIGR03435 family protein n=1 Tax=Granulicella sp. 5B5 TaxID=1617967 RepID=UPI0015F406EE|nr:TIGR03435 family protein [Granulicella sp. 5B5]QMV18994.1 TIGR03435 family protein [Granulicella sp. 5B5]
MIHNSARTLLLAALLTVPLHGIHAQAPPIPVSDLSTPAATTDVNLPVYDIASVKPSDPSARGMRIMNTPDGFSCNNISLKTLIGNAYGIRQDQITGGPSWVDSSGFDVQAKVAGQDLEAYKKLTQRQRESLLQPLLADRFHLKLHHETKVLPEYDLVLAKGGSKLKPSAPFTPPPDAAKDPVAARRPGRMMMGPGTLQGQGIPMKTIANQLSYVLHYPVIDKTGLTGDFDFELKWRSDESGPPAASDDAGVSIFTAVQEQLGLKLQSTKGPVDTLVIDQAEKPSEN